MLPKRQARIVLAKRPTTNVVPGEHLVLHEDAMVREPQEGEIVVRTLWMSLDPAMRGWMNNWKSYIAPVKLGDVMRANGVGEVVLSKSPRFQKGQLVQGLFGMQEYATVAAAEAELCQVPAGIPVSAALGVLGLTGLTAYFGLLDVGQPKAGETVVVSAAAGATGSVAAQIAKRCVGCRVVGIAGGAAKCAWLRDELGLDAAVDYKSPSFAKDLKRACPKGVDVYFDNVGGRVLDEVLRFLNLRARVVICGAISVYNKDKVQGPVNYLSLAANRARMEGFIVFDYAKQYPQALQDLARWLQEGKLQYKEDVVHGLRHAPEALLKLFEGSNTGKLVVKITEQSPPASKL